MHGPRCLTSSRTETEISPPTLVPRGLRLKVALPHSKVRAPSAASRLTLSRRGSTHSPEELSKVIEPLGVIVRSAMYLSVAEPVPKELSCWYRTDAWRTYSPAGQDMGSEDEEGPPPAEEHAVAATIMNRSVTDPFMEVSQPAASKKNRSHIAPGICHFDTGPFNWYIIEDEGRLTLVRTWAHSGIRKGTRPASIQWTLGNRSAWCSRSRGPR